jgi:hypothetical protein
VFPGSALEKHEIAMMDDPSHAKVLVHSTSPSVHGWLRCCPQPAGEAGGGTSEDWKASSHCLTEESASPAAPMILG